MRADTQFLRQRGAALIEALVAILVLSVGLLGLVGLQTASVKYQQNSWARSAIATQVADISDRIRANPGAGNTDYVYSVAYSTERGNMANSSTFTVSPDCGSATCTPAQLATYDIKKWRSSLNSSIPGAVGYITGSRSSSYSITIAWLDKSRLDTNTTTALEASKADLCSTVAASNAAGLRNCCPDALFSSTALDGVRCINFSLVP